MLIKIYEENPNQRMVRKVIDCLRKGGLIIYPTDTLYSIGCDLHNPKALERLARLKGLKPEKTNFSLICSDLSHLSEFCRPLDNKIYKMMKRTLPGAFTYILESNSNVPRIFKRKKKTIGIRVPDNGIVQHIVREFGGPIIATSVYVDDDNIEYTTDPELIHEKYIEKVDMVIDGGFGGIEASTIVDCTSSTPEIVREGKGDVGLVY